MINEIEFENWFSELKEVYIRNHFHRSSIESLKKEDYKLFFEEKKSPEEAYKEDQKHNHE